MGVSDLHAQGASPLACTATREGGREEKESTVHTIFFPEKVFPKPHFLLTSKRRHKH